MKENIRLVSGDSDGNTIQWDRSKSGPIIKIPKHPSFPSCRGCGTDVAEAANIHIDEYHIQEIQYGSGHRHLFAAPEKMRAVDIMNVLWDNYQNQG